jgi:hypothetical protein
MKCPKCGTEMEMFGVTENGQYKYYCKKCHIIELKERIK